jgi:hypothetical protein
VEGDMCVAAQQAAVARIAASDVAALHRAGCLSAMARVWQSTPSPSASSRAPP